MALKKDRTYQTILSREFLGRRVEVWVSPHFRLKIQSFERSRVIWIEIGHYRIDIIRA